MPIMEVVVETLYQEQTCINTWNYVASGTPSAVSFSFALTYALGFTNPPIDPALGTDFWSRLRQVQNNGVQYVQVAVRDVNSDTDFFSNPLSGAFGLEVGQNSASFIAFGFRTGQTTKKVRPGQKRLVGVNDEDTVSGGGFTAGAIARMDNFAIEMSEDQTYDDNGQILTFKPAVCAKEPYVTPSGRTAYKYYEGEAEQLLHTSQSPVWKKKGRVRSQVSRQVGRGN